MNSIEWTLVGVGIWTANIVLIVTMMRRLKRAMVKNDIEPTRPLRRLFWKLV